MYKISCECGRAYVGETGRMLKQRMTEHKRAIRNVDNNNGLAVHVAGTEHEIRWDEAEVVCREEQWTKCKIKEGLQIKAHAGNLIWIREHSLTRIGIPPPSSFHLITPHYYFTHFIFSPRIIILLSLHLHLILTISHPIPSPFRTIHTPVSHLVSI